MLEGEELQDAEIDGRVETKPALIGTNRAVHLDAKTAVDLNVAALVHPRYAEHDHTLGLDDPLEHFGASIFGVFVENDDEGLRHFFDSLMKLGLGRVLGFHVGHESLHGIRHRV